MVSFNEQCRYRSVGGACDLNLAAQAKLRTFGKESMESCRLRWINKHIMCKRIWLKKNDASHPRCFSPLFAFPKKLFLIPQILKSHLTLCITLQVREFLYMPEISTSIPCNEFGLDIFMSNIWVTTILNCLYTVNRIEHIAKLLNIAKKVCSFKQRFSKMLMPRTPPPNMMMPLQENRFENIKEATFILCEEKADYYKESMLFLIEAFNSSYTF